MDFGSQFTSSVCRPIRYRLPRFSFCAVAKPENSEIFPRSVWKSKFKIQNFCIRCSRESIFSTLHSAEHAGKLSLSAFFFPVGLKVKEISNFNDAKLLGNRKAVTTISVLTTLPLGCDALPVFEESKFFATEDENCRTGIFQIIR